MRTAALIAATALALAACGTTADPEEVKELTTVLTSNNSPLGLPLTDDQAQCLARAYLESGLSSKAIDNLKSGQPLAPATDDDAKAIAKISKKVTDCM